MVHFVEHLPADDMHAQDLVELAAIVAAHGGLLIGSGIAQLTDQHLQAYWLASKCRLDRWGTAFKELREAGGGGHCSPRWVRPLIEEVFASETLARVWTAAVTAFDQQRESADAVAVMSNVLNGLVEARHRALRILADSDVIHQDDARRLTRVHRRMNRWVDLLMAYLQRYHEVSRYAILPDRCRDFATDLRRQSARPGGRHTWRLTFSSLRQTLCRELSPQSPNGDLNFKVGASIISCFDIRDFESVGALRSVWLIRLLDTSAHCETMVGQLLADG